MSNFIQKRAALINEDGIRGMTFYGITLGRVVSTDDPQQMGRLFVVCPELGDPPDMSPEDFTSLPPCTYLSPFAGTTESDQARGPEQTYSRGPITYGMWAIPKRGAIVAVMCINGNPNNRVWVGSVYEQYVTNTLPHGRFFFESGDGQIPHPNGAPEGPLSATEHPIQPIYDNQTEAFKSRLKNFEWRTRGADFQNTAINKGSTLDPSPCNTPDDDEVEFTQEDGTKVTITQGMAPGRDNEGVVDNQTYSWTTPGFHSISMDDRESNCRIRFRTTAGHQILMDDTNERIYIQTCKGNNWIEIDEDGSIDIFSTEKISASAKDVNFTAENTIRLYGKQGVHIKSDADIRFQAGANIATTVEGNVDIKVGGYVHETANAHHLKSATDVNISGTDINLKGSTSIKESAGSGGHHTQTSGNIVETGTQIHMNGPQASAAAPATAADPQPTFLTNRYPQHEPWARTSTKNDLTHDPKYEYNDPLVGREHKARGKNWRR